MASIVPWDQCLSIPHHWTDRPSAETNRDLQQVIPYAVLLDPVGKLWAYRRTGGDARLRQRASIGVGGHIEDVDEQGNFLATVRAALWRELNEELQQPPNFVDAKPLAWINEQVSAVGQVHLGLVFAVAWTLPSDPMPKPGEGLEAIGFVDPEEVTEAAGFELWSVLAAQALRASP
ncbi:hypothetical protein ACVBEH_04270 [Roseateles sp. GG27B]